MPEIFKRLLILFLIIFSIISVNYASINDSIPSEINQIKDTATISKIIRYAKQISKTDKDSAEVLFILAENASVMLSNEKSLIISLFEYGVFLYSISERDKAFNKLQQSYNKASVINFEEYLYLPLSYLSAIYMVKSNYEIAVEYALKALDYYEKKKEYKLAAGILLNLTYIQIEQKDFNKAEEYALLSYKYARITKCEPYISKSLLNIGVTYFNRFEYKKSISYYRKSLNVADKINYEGTKNINFINIGTAYKELNQLDSALFYAKTVVEYENYYNEKSFIVPQSYLLLSEIYELRNNYKKAKNYAHKALIYSDSVQLFQESAKAYNSLSQLYAKSGDYKTAFKYKIKATIINDSIFTQEKYRIQNDLEAVYETNKKQIEIERLSKEKEISDLKNQKSKYILFSLIFVLVVVVVIGILIFRQNKLRAKHTSIELEQKLLRTQMNPHFIFNSISSIQDFIMTNNPLEASSYLSDFAKLMRATLTNSSDNFISLENEIETIEKYLKLQHLRISQKFDYKIVIPEDFDAYDYSVPPMLLQPFIENSIIHGFKNKSDKKGIITVSYKLENNFLIMETKDNGIGRQKSTLNKKTSHISKAGSITEQRIELLTKKFKQNIDFEIIDLKDANNNSSGTLVRFRLPLK